MFQNYSDLDAGGSAAAAVPEEATEAASPAEAEGSSARGTGSAPTRECLFGAKNDQNGLKRTQKKGHADGSIPRQGL